MAKYRYIQCIFWSDPDIQEFTPEDKLFYLYLLTNEHSKQCGISEITTKRMAFELGFSRDTIDTLLVRFIDYGKIKYDRRTNEIAIKNWRKYNPDSSPTVKACISNELKEVKSKELIQYLYPTDTPTLQEKEKEKEKEKEVIIKASPENLSLAELLFSEIQKNYPKAKNPNLQKWANDIRLLQEQDKLTEEEIRIVILWCQKDGFWKTVILSAANFRKNFQKLYLQSKNGNGKQKPATIANSASDLRNLHRQLEETERKFHQRNSGT